VCFSVCVCVCLIFFVCAMDPCALVAVAASDIVEKCIFVSVAAHDVNFVCDQLHVHDRCA